MQHEMRGIPGADLTMAQGTDRNAQSDMFYKLYAKNGCTKPDGSNLTLKLIFHYSPLYKFQMDTVVKLLSRHAKFTYMQYRTLHKHTKITLMFNYCT